MSNGVDRTDIYQDAAGGWRWRRIAANNEIIADSSESYTRRADASRAARRVFRSVARQVVRHLNAERLAADPSLATHGRASTYDNWLCRCVRCRQANAQRMAISRADRKERLAADPTLVEHGKESTYANWCCRCPACTAAATERASDRVARRHT